MLGDISPQTVRITQQAVVYPGRDHVVELRVERFDGRKYAPVDMTDVTRVILSFPEADPVIVYDSAVQAVFTHVGSTLTVDLSDYAMPASVLGCQIILYDAEHPAGQVLVDDIDSVVQFDFRNVSTTGGTPPPAAEYITDAPIDGVTYARKDGLWVPVDALVSGVSSVNGQSGVVVLDAADVGADPAGAATTSAAAAVAAHEADTTPHAFVQSVSKLGFNTSAAQTAGTAELAWNVTDATVDLGLPGGVTLQVGQEFLLRGLNNSGATMVDTTVVYISGAQGNRTVFAKAQANAVTADKTIGVLTQDITNNQEGFATLAGLVRNINTSAWAEGSELWLSAATAGLLTNIKPPAPNNAVSLGYVVRSHASLGSIYVRVAVRESIRELHDVVITAPTDGQVLVYDAATSTWVNEAGGGGSGEVNTASNLGTGSGLFAGKVGVDLQFKSLKAGAGVTLSSTATEVTIVASGAGGAVDSVNGQTGVVVLDTDDIAEGVSNLYFTNGRAAAAAPVQTVDGQTGAVSLSSSYAPLSHVGDGGAAHSNAVAAGAAGFMTGADKTKLDGIAAGATANATDAELRDRSTHTGTQTASTISDFAATVRTTVLTGLSLASGAAIAATDSALVAWGKLQKQINDLVAAVGGKQDTLVSGTNIKTVNGSSLLGSGNLTVSGGASLPVVQTFTGAKVLALTDINTYNVSQDATAQPVTLPAQATVAWTDDAELHIEQGAAGAVTITGAAGVTINGVVAPSIVLFAQGAVATLKRKGLNNWTLVGSIGTAADQRAALGLGSITGINRIINGAFNINQRAVSGTVALAAGAYGHDRWKAGASGCTYTFATTANVTTITITAGSLQQVIEGINLQSGTHTLSWTGTAQGKIGAGSYGASGVTGTAVGGTNLTVEFNTGTLNFAQLQAGSVALPFEHRPYGQELALCQRYYFRVTPVDADKTFCLGFVISATDSINVMALPVPMRSVPTLEHSGIGSDYMVGIAGANVACTSTPVLSGRSTNIVAQILHSTAGGLTTGQGCSSKNNTSNGYLGFSAEL